MAKRIKIAGLNLNKASDRYLLLSVMKDPVLNGKIGCADTALCSFSEFNTLVKKLSLPGPLKVTKAEEYILKEYIEDHGNIEAYLRVRLDNLDHESDLRLRERQDLI